MLGVGGVLCMCSSMTADKYAHVVCMGEVYVENTSQNQLISFFALHLNFQSRVFH